MKKHVGPYQTLSLGATICHCNRRH